MKTATIILSVLLLVATASDADTVKMTWKQPAADTASLKEWQVFYGNAPNPTQLFVTVPFTAGQASYQITQTIPAPTGTPGTKVKYYFSIAAISKNGYIGNKVAGKTAAGLDYIELTIPYQNVGDPYEVIIELILAPAASSDLTPQPAPKTTKTSPAANVLKGQIPQ